MFVYKTTGTCAKEIHLDVQGGVIHSVEFVLGCPGFTQALIRVLVGMPAEEAITQLEGIQCLDKGTSCPDQLAKALRQSLSPTASL
ncbi:TIGR03905 family TSCPD domain-containing protein [Gemmiger formicilis]|uniref:TIGR03905 family TSCPD domain-containing protein n=1 Tax=Gemmiger formicilis TaxID=745368 RepID=UPI0019579AA2|nr:TIGR03905 family TSCPD domain-containing protein [Gemmiger formicilis]MBM6717790.1 TIGR03905 family TSCPD domain-containing protein [Gemmiger formicilis]